MFSFDWYRRDGTGYVSMSGYVKSFHKHVCVCVYDKQSAEKTTVNWNGGLLETILEFARWSINPKGDNSSADICGLS